MDFKSFKILKELKGSPIVVPFTEYVLRVPKNTRNSMPLHVAILITKIREHFNFL
jgi:hypothetical protein